MIRALKNRLRARRIRSCGWGRTWSADELRILKGDALTTADQREQLRRQLLWPAGEYAALMAAPELNE